jgi:threonine aldolase
MTTVPPFRSDNTAGAAPEVLEAIVKASEGPAAAYGKDNLSVALNEAMSEIFERRCWCFPVSSGTAANALALSAISAADTMIACHAEAHIVRHEDYAAEFFTPGVRLEPLTGDAGRISFDALEAFARAAEANRSRWSALGITQLTESGTVYGLDEIASLAEVAHRYGAQVHLDGARFANAVVSLHASPADLSWRGGVDILSFGATKNGALNADAIVAFDARVGAEVESRLKRSGQLQSKMRFMAAQLLAMLKGDLWLRNAAHANSMARRLHERLAGVSGVEILFPVDGNHLFVRLGAKQKLALQNAAAEPWRARTDESGEPIFRLVTSFSTGADEIDRFAALLAE